MKTHIFHLIRYEGPFYVYFNLNLRSYGQLFVLVLLIYYNFEHSQHKFIQIFIKAKERFHVKETIIKNHMYIIYCNLLCSKTCVMCIKKEKKKERKDY